MCSAHRVPCLGSIHRYYVYCAAEDDEMVTQWHLEDHLVDHGFIQRCNHGYGHLLVIRYNY